MTALKIIDKIKILDKDFLVYGTEEEPLFLAKDVATWIDHSKTAMMLASVDDDKKLICKIYQSGQIRGMWFITKNGLLQILSNSRKTKAKILQQYISTWRYKVVPKETSFGLMLREILDGLADFNEQYIVDSYKIDFYFPQSNLAVEYDEKHHQHQRKEDIKRQKYITDKINCSFIRVQEGKELDGLNKVLTKILT